MCLCVCVCTCVLPSAMPEEVRGSPRAGVPAVGICPARLLETEPQVSVRASSTRSQILKSRENSSTGKQHIKLKDEQAQLGSLCFLYRSRSQNLKFCYVKHKDGNCR